MPKYHPNTSSNADDRVRESLEHLARDGLCAFLHNLRKPDRRELVGKIVLELERTTQQYRALVTQDHPDHASLNLLRLRFVELAQDYKRLTGRKYEIGAYFFDEKTRQCRKNPHYRKPSG